MAFIIEDNTVISFAEFKDVVDRDQRLFDNNESLTDDVVETLLIRATERIITKIKATGWWSSYFKKQDNNSTVINTVADIPNPDINKIIGRSNDFTDLCVYEAMAEYILPMVADFGDLDSAERQKMDYYTTKSTNLFIELVNFGDWYDFDGDDVIESLEKTPGYFNLKRVR